MAKLPNYGSVAIIAQHLPRVHPIARKITQIPIKTHKPIICLIKWLMITEKVGVCAQLIEIARNQHD